MAFVLTPVLPLDVCKHIEALRIERPPGTYIHFLNIISSGNIKCVQWYVENIQNEEFFSSFAVSTAAKAGHLDIVQYMHDCGLFKWDTFVMDYACGSGNLELVKWLHHNRNEGCSMNAMAFAGEHGHLDVLRWLHVNRTEGYDDFLSSQTVIGGHLHVLEWVHNHLDIQITNFHLSFACVRGHTHILQWLFDHYNDLFMSEIDMCINIAISRENLDVLKWYFEIRKVPMKLSYIRAVHRKNSDVLLEYIGTLRT